MRHRLSAALAAAVLASLASGAAAQQSGPRPVLGLMGTIPIYWGEAAGVAEVLGGMGEPHWARARLEGRFALRPLAALTGAELAGLERLLLAQPRALSPAENVALDAWVRAGGELLLFADPMMTGESRFGLGDRRRPQDVILLSPILDHWGLALEFETDQPAGTVEREIAGQTLPLNLPGRFASPDEASGCALAGAGVLAQCTVGEGRVVVLADAALLDLHHPHPAAPSALDSLLERAFNPAGENAGTGDGAVPGSGHKEEQAAPRASPERGDADRPQAPVQNPP